MHVREQRLRERIAHIEDYAQKRACPIYGVAGNEARLIGSGFLVRVLDATLLVTAAHVLYLKRGFDLHMPGPGKLVPFEGISHSTCTLNAHGQPDFGYDIAFVVLRPESIAALADCEVLTPADFDLNDQPAPATLYGFTGFPGSQNKVRPPRTFRRSSVIITVTPAPYDAYKKINYSPATHFAINFDRKQMVTRNLRVATAPDPHGVSGGPVWRLGALSDIEAGVAKPVVVALAIEWLQPLKILVGVRVSLLAEGIGRALPQARSLFPPSKHVKANITLTSRTSAPGVRRAL